VQRSLALSLAVLALVIYAAPAHGASIVGPAGLRIGKLPTSITCPPAELNVSVRFTAASKRRGVRAVRIVVRGTRVSGVPIKKTLRVKRKRVRRAKLLVPCCARFLVRFEALRRGGRVIGKRTIRLSSRLVPDRGGAPGDLTGPPPGAQARPPDSTTTWTATVDERRTGTRAGQTCVQVSATTADNRRASATSFCGLLSEDPVFAKTQDITDLDGVTRRVLAGAANVNTVASVAVLSPARLQELPLTAPPAQGAPSSGAGFIALFDPATTRVEDLTLVVRLKAGTTQSHPAPRALNLRGQNGERL
jgi:hypothetical protein